MTPFESIAKRELNEREAARRGLARERTAAFESGLHPELGKLYSEHEREIAELGDPWVPKLRSRLDDIIEKSLQLDFESVRDGSRLEAIIVDGGSINAIHTPYSDQSGLIELNLGLFKTVDILSVSFGEILAPVFSAPGLWSGFKAMVRAASPDQDPVEFAVRVGLTRHSLVQRMAPFLGHEDLVFNRSAASARIGSALQHLATEFILAHEVSHHLLGHGAAHFAPGGEVGEPLIACTASKELELQADGLAMDILLSGQKNTSLTAMGIILALESITLTEKVLFIRNGVTHPSVEDRRTLLFARMSLAQRAQTVRVFEPVKQVIKRASDFTDPLPMSWWKQLEEDHRVIDPGSNSRHFEIAYHIDSLLSLADKECSSLLERIDSRLGSSLADGARTLSNEEDAEGALRNWGVKKVRARNVCDSSQALSFRDSVDAIKSGIRQKYCIPEGASHQAAIAAARLVAPFLINKEDK